MKKRVVDAAPAELDRLAASAWSTAAKDARSRGVAAFGRKGGRLVTVRPDGTVEAADDRNDPVTKRGRKARQPA